MHKYRTLLSYAERQRGRFALIFLLTLGTSVLTAVQPWPLKLLADQVLGKRSLPGWLNHWFSGTPSQLVFWIVIAGLLIFLAGSTLDMALTWMWTKAGRRMVYDLAEDLFARLQRRSLLFHGRHSVGDTMSRITRDCWCVHQVLDTLFFAPLHALFTIVAMVYLMASLDLSMTIVSVALAPLMVGASFLITKPLRAAAKLKREVESQIHSHIQQTLTGIPVVQAFGQEEREQLRFETFADQAIEAQQRTLLAGSVNTLASGLVTVSGTGVILWLGANHVLEGKLTVGGILVFLAYLSSLQAQIKIFANIHNALQDFHASVERVVETLEAAPEVNEKQGALSVERIGGVVAFEQVAFEYVPGQPVLRDIQFETAPGETIAIVGATGAGKSTLVNLIPRFFDPTEGRVLLDGKDLRDLKLKDLRRQVAVVLQEPFLFPLSVAENVAYGRPGASFEEIRAAAKKANANTFIENLPQGYETILGEHGSTISGGERQRIAIARAVLKDAPILILDEPTSALDAQTEESILEALDRLMEGRTTFIIAHRLSTIRRADRVLVMEAGRIAEAGTHDELMLRGGIYAKLQELQFASGELERTTA